MLPAAPAAPPGPASRAIYPVRLLRRYGAYRRSRRLAWRDVAIFFGGAWAIGGIVRVDRSLPAAISRDLLYLLPVGLTTWWFGWDGAW